MRCFKIRLLNHSSFSANKVMKVHETKESKPLLGLSAEEVYQKEVVSRLCIVPRFDGEPHPLHPVEVHCCHW